MKSIASLAAVSALFFASAAEAGDAAVEATIHQFISSFNKGDVKTAKAAHVASPTITDEMAPYHWSGPKAFDTWVADLTKAEAAEGKSAGALTMAAASRQLVSGDHAYVIVPSTYTFQQKGRTMHEVSQMTYVLTKGKSGWKIESWAWTGPDASPVM